MYTWKIFCIIGKLHARTVVAFSINHSSISGFYLYFSVFFRFSTTGTCYFYDSPKPGHVAHYNVFKSEGPGPAGQGAPLFSAVFPGRDGGPLRETGGGGRQRTEWVTFAAGIQLCSLREGIFIGVGFRVTLSSRSCGLTSEGLLMSAL